jgi:pimeloyl-ACP methyl ester carboxylesterase
MILSVKNFLRLFLSLVFAGSTSVSFAATDKCPCGDWLGTMTYGGKSLRAIFHISKEGDSLKVKMDSPDQNVKGIAATGAESANKHVKISFGAAFFDGEQINDSTINGSWHQGGVEIPLVLHKVEMIEAPEKPQTPVPPFPYASEDLTFNDSSTRLTYGATITYPSDNEKHPAILLITGSGQQDRNEEILDHKPFFVIADYLTRMGLVVLRVDDRGIGQTTGRLSLSSATTKDFANDANAALEYLKTRKEVDPRRIGLLGHSEGGMIATMLAAQRKDVNFIISMAGPGIPIKQLMLDQNNAIMKQQGFSDAIRMNYLKLYSTMVDSVLAHKKLTDATEAVEKAVRNWKSVTPDSIVVAATQITDEATLKEYSKDFAMQMIPWYRYFFSYNPQPDIRALQCKVLALNGEKDIQVVAEPNLKGWSASLAKSKARAKTVEMLPGLNHLFQECKTCGTDEYGTLEQTISPAALKRISDWLKEQGIR